MTSKHQELLPVEEILDEIRQAIEPLLERDPLMVAVQTGGLWIAEYLHEVLQLEEPVGALDISFYRDDFSQIGINPEVHASYFPVAIDDRHIILIDDVLHTGRTIRAALNELFAWGRPASVVLAVLLDRGNRELPLQAEVVGHSMSMNNDQFAKVSPNGRVTYSVRSDS